MKPNLEPFIIEAQSMHELIIAPAFQDLIPNSDSGSPAINYRGFLQEFTLMDNIKSSRNIVDIKRVRNILQRRDASCDIVYKKIMGASNRKITVDELVAATNHCKHEFYQGCLKDWRNADPVFGDKILPYFKSAVSADLASNAYFGDIDRIETPTMTFSTTKFNGIWKFIKAYTAAGIIPANQTIALTPTDYRANPAAAYALLQALVDRQNYLMRSFGNDEKEIYCTQALLDGYLKYLKSIGTTADVIYLYANGVKIYSIDGIAIKPISIWEPILTEIYGAPNYNAAVLTLAGNFVFGTDKDYGEGETDTEALMVWYEKIKLSWYYQMFLKAGTQIALPEHIVYAFPNA